MLPVNIARYLNFFYPSLTWRSDERTKVVHLTFDDGPHPGISRWVMDELDKFGFTATFFCIGENMMKHPEVVQEMLERGHRIGNHTFNHLSGFGTPTDKYIENVEGWSDEHSSKLFRPPYGRIRRAQIKALQGQYNIVMWSILSWDFKVGIDHGKVLRQMKRGTEPGSIVVFHDSEKAEANLKSMLTPFCEYLRSEGYRSKAL